MTKTNVNTFDHQTRYTRFYLPRKTINTFFFFFGLHNHLYLDKCDATLVESVLTSKRKRIRLTANRFQGFL